MSDQKIKLIMATVVGLVVLAAVSLAGAPFWAGLGFGIIAGMIVDAN